MNSSMSQKWESCRGISPRVINIINQCKYLASKRGMSLRELRKALREDEARQRQFIRQNESNSQYQNMHFLNPCQVPGSHVPPAANHWFAHANNHGMLFSQYNIQNYGQNYKHSNRCGVTSGKSSQTGGVNCRTFHDPRTSHRSCTGRNDSCSSEDDLRKQRPPADGSIASISSSGEDDNNLVNLLYAANMSNETMKNRNPTTPPIGSATTSLANPRNILNSRQGTAADIPNSISSVNPLVMSDSFLHCNLPVRKLASHNLTSHQHSSNEDFSVLMSNDNFKRKDQDEGACMDGENEDGNSGADSDSDTSEIHIIEELDKDKSVVSPLIKKAESAFANLRQKDTLFGNLDDFGDLMTTANRIF